MNQKIQGNWNRQQEVGGQVIVKFTIQRDGRLVEPTIERSSGVAALDNAARRAVEVTRQLTPLPAAYTNPLLTIHLTFEYQ
jgi:TonB family protein